MVPYRVTTGQNRSRLGLKFSDMPRLLLPNPPNLLLLPEPQLMGLSLSPPLFIPAPTKSPSCRFFGNKGEVAGVFTVVGLITVAILFTAVTTVTPPTLTTTITHTTDIPPRATERMVSRPCLMAEGIRRRVML
jgi:hypothetical protein